MSDLSTYSRFKDYLLLAAIAAVLSLAGLVFTSDRGRLSRLEAVLEEKGSRIEAQAGRIATLEAARVNEREETLRRLSRIEDKIDNLATPQGGR